MRRRLEGIKGLSKRETQIAELYATGLPCKAIAAKLFISPKTVSTHRDRICVKLNLSTKGLWLEFVATLRSMLVFEPISETLHNIEIQVSEVPA